MRLVLTSPQPSTPSTPSPPSTPGPQLGLLEPPEGSRQRLSRVQPWDPAISRAQAAQAALAPISAGCGELPQPGRRAATGDLHGPIENCELPAPLPPLPATPAPFPRPLPRPRYSQCTRGLGRGRAAPARPARPAPQGPFCGQHGRAGRGLLRAGAGRRGRYRQPGPGSPVPPGAAARSPPGPAQRRRRWPRPSGWPRPLIRSPQPERALQAPPPAAHWLRGLNEVKLIGRSAARRSLIG